MSEGWTATQWSEAPRTALWWCSPVTAGQPLPGTRLLQGPLTSVK